MPETRFHGRRAVAIENPDLRVTVLVEGGHIAELQDKASGVNPLWIPPWPSIEPSTYSRSGHPEYGDDAEAKLLAGIMGHNLCLDIFGSPSADEAAAGLTTHGEASVVPYRIEAGGAGLIMRAELPIAQLRLERRITLEPHAIEIAEAVENVSAADRPVGWTQHVTLGPPFLENGSTQFRASATRSKVYETDFTGGTGYMRTGEVFDWPQVPRTGGGSVDLRVYSGLAASAGYTTHLMDPHREHAFFTAFSPRSNVALGYLWKRADFPWLGIWEENRSRQQPPWRGKAITRGLEFGVSPMPETRRQMVERGSLFGVPGFRWIPAKSKVEVKYWAAIGKAAAVPESMRWSREGGVAFGD
ncbi:MAG: hypothetical protein FJW37_11180 [Acidobacteria bacterium]|nr:hypothetical protein [Acidobacteriota bacterium]